MRLKTILLILCATLSSVLGDALAQSVVFTPDELFAAIDERSSSVRLASLVVDDAQHGVDVARSAYLPEINANWQIGYLGNGYLTDRNFSNGMGIDNPHFVNNLALEAMQVVYAGGAVREGVKLAELRTRLAETGLDANRQEVRFIIISKLIDLQCVSRRKEVIEQNITLAQDVLAQMRLRHEQGLLLANDITRYELQVADLELQRDRLDEAWRVVNSSIATALDYPEGTTFGLAIDAIDENYPLAAMDTWQTQAEAANPALRQASLAKDVSTSLLRLAKAERLPKVGAFVYGQFNSPITIEVPVLNKNFMYWGFGLNISYSLSSIYKTGRKEAQARVGILESEQRQELALQGVRDQVTEAYEAFRTAQSQLRTQRYSLTLANENYQVVSDRFAEGMALVTDLVDAANVRIGAQTGVENAQSQLLYCLYRLKYITNTLTL